jgi:SpoVK/Ycf46/Vps4 family AAA+-type ATPase
MFVLKQEPANLQALFIAAQAAAALGDSAREQGYRRVIRALSGIADVQSLPNPTLLHPDMMDHPPARDTSNQETSKQGDRVALPAHDDADDADGLWPSERSWVTLADVGGMESVKQRLNVAFLAPLRNPDFRKMYGKSLRGGLLLFGPPGCGKTYIARALAGELTASFIAVGLSDVLDMWLGQSEQRLHHIFDSARRQAPCVVFFDEIDALGQKRSQLKHSAGRNVVNQLLAELDGIGSDNEGVFVLGATNHPWDVDSALLRPGRFDRMILVLPPDQPARAAIVRTHLATRPAEGVDAEWIAAHTDGFSGADLAHLCESATELAMTDSLTSGTIRPLSTADFKRALKDVRASTRAWFDIARNYALFANEGGTYDELLAYMRTHKLL